VKTVPHNPLSIKTLPMSTVIIRPEILHFAQIDSTNRYLLDNNHHPRGTVALADYQSRGRGRHGRSWIAPEAQGLLFSTLLKEDLHRNPLHPYTFLAAVSVFEGLSPFVDPQELQLKWPNDVLLQERKVCGILVQSKIRSPREATIVIGIGVNVNQPAHAFREDLQAGISLAVATGGSFDRYVILREILIRLDQQLAQFYREGSEAVLLRWKSCCPSLGKAIAVDDGQTVQRGIFKDLRPDGGLLLEGPEGEKTFYAADVSIVKENS